MNTWGIFAIVPAVFLFFYWALPMFSDATPDERNAPTSIAAVNFPTAVTPAPVRLEKINYEAFAMLPKVEEKPKVVVRKKVKFNLDSILMSNTGTLAVINGKIVEQGTRLAGGFYVSKISPRSVVVRRGATTRVLRFPEYINKGKKSSHPESIVVTKTIQAPNPAISGVSVEKNLQGMKW